MTRLLRSQIPTDTLYRDYAFIHRHGDQALGIDLEDLFHKIPFTTDGIGSVSTPDAANDRIVVGASRAYEVDIECTGIVTGAAQRLEVAAFGIAQAGLGITSITKADPAVVTTDAAHGRINGDRVKIYDATTMTEVNDHLYIVAGKTDDTFQLTDEEGVNVNSGAWGVHDAGSGEVALATKLTHDDRTFTNASGYGSFGKSEFVNLTLGDYLEAYLRNETSANEFTVHVVNMLLRGI